MKKNNKNLMVIGVIVLTAILYSSYSASSDSMLNYRLYDQYGNEIKTQLWWLLPKSIVGNVQGVYGISFDVNIKNTGQVPIEAKIADAQPLALKNSFPYLPVNVPAGETKKISSGIISTGQFESMAQPVKFSTDVDATYQYAGQTKTLPKKGGSIDISIKPDLVAGFEVEFVSSAGNSSLDSCTPSALKVTLPSIFKCDSTGFVYNTIETNCFNLVWSDTYGSAYCKEANGYCNVYVQDGNLGGAWKIQNTVSPGSVVAPWAQGAYGLLTC